MLHKSSNIPCFQDDPQPNMSLYEDESITGGRTPVLDSSSQEIDHKNLQPEMSVKPNDLTSRPSPGLEEDGRMSDRQSDRDKKIPTPLKAFKEDLNNFKEDFVQMFRDKHAKTTDPLTVLKEDFGHFKEDLTNVFKINLSKAKEDKASVSKTSLLKEDLHNTFKLKVLKEKSDGLTSSKPGLSNVKAPHPREDKMQKDKKSRSEKNKGQMKRDIKVGPTEEWTKRKDSLPEQSSESVSGQEDLLSGNQGRVEDFQLSTTLPWPLSLHGNNDSVTGEVEGDCWWIKRYACYLTLDPNTANVELSLSEDKRRASRGWLDHQYPAHPDRFCCPQVLCREGLLESTYWEVEWAGGADIGVTYSSICREGDAGRCLLGHNSASWSLECSDGFYTPCHNDKRCRASHPRPFARRVGVFLDWGAGTLSFYCVSTEKLTLLHCFNATFTEQMYPAFWLWGQGSSVALSHVGLCRERLVNLNNVPPGGGDICLIPKGTGQGSVLEQGRES